MRRLFKRIGRVFIVLRKIDGHSLRNDILLVDGGFISPNSFALILRGVQEKFKNANIAVLTFKEKETLIKDSFHDVEVIIPGDYGIGRYSLAIKLFLLIRRRYSHIVLSSLDASILLVSMFFARQPVLLHNKWFEWYRVRHRTFSDIILRTKSADINRRRTNHGARELMKSFGRGFVILSNLCEEELNTPVLILDDNREDIGRILTAVRRSLENFINPDITILTSVSRRNYFTNAGYGNIKISIGMDSYDRCSAAIQLYRMRKIKFSSIVLPNLNITPIFSALIFMGGKVLLYNRWHEWWSLRFRNLYDCIKLAIDFIFKVLSFIYLLIVSGYILLRMGVRYLWLG